MPSLNKVMLIGNLGGDPEIAATRDNRAVAKVSLATNRKYKDRVSGQTQTTTQWHNLVFFDKLAEIAGKYLRKGALVYVEGRLNTRQYELEGSVRYITEIVADKLEMLDGRPEEGTRPAPSHHNGQQADSYTYDDDIPF